VSNLNKKEKKENREETKKMETAIQIRQKITIIKKRTNDYV